MDEARWRLPPAGVAITLRTGTFATFSADGGRGALAGAVVVKGAGYAHYKVNVNR